MKLTRTQKRLLGVLSGRQQEWTTAGTLMARPADLDAMVDAGLLASVRLDYPGVPANEKGYAITDAGQEALGEQ